MDKDLEEFIDKTKDETFKSLPEAIRLLAETQTKYSMELIKFLESAKNNLPPVKFEAVLASTLTALLLMFSDTIDRSCFILEQIKKGIQRTDKEIRCQEP